MPDFFSIWQNLEYFYVEYYNSYKDMGGAE